MSKPFEVGDVVVCVDNTPCRYNAKAALLRVGAIYKVAAVGVVYGDVMIAFHTLPSKRQNFGWAWKADRFRHLPKATEEFTASIRACKPIKERI